MSPYAQESGLRLWGLDAAAYLPLPLVLAVLAAAAIGIALVLRGRDPVRAFRLPAWIPAVGTLLLFFVLQSRYALLGDNLLRVQEALNGTSNPYERGVMALHHAILGLAGAQTAEAGERVFTWMSLAAGAVYAAAAWGMGRPTGRGGFWITLGLMGSGITAIFCGYVEVYPWVLAWLMVSVLAAAAAARGTVPVFVPVLLAVPGVLLHTVFVLWLPALLAPMLLRLIPDSRVSRVRWLVAGGVVAGLALGIALGGRFSVLLSPVPAAGRYTLFSTAHVSDYLNAQVLGSLAGFLLAIPALLVWWRRPHPSRESVVLALAWLLPAAALFLFRPLLGGADWDILALAAPFSFAFAGGVLAGPEWAPDSASTRSKPADPHALFWSRLVPAIVILSFAHTILWLSLQAGEGSIQRFRDLIRADRADYFIDHPPEMHLGFVFQTNGRPDLAKGEFLAGVERYPQDPRFPMNLAALASNQRDWDAAEEWAVRAYRLRRGYLAPLDVLYDAHKMRGRSQEQILVGRTILSAHESQPEEVEGILPRQRIEQIRQEVIALEKKLPDTLGKTP